MSRDRKLVKRWRLDQVYIHDLGVCAGIYVDKHSGEFFARVPEADDGELFEDRDKRNLQNTVREALKNYYGLDWQPVIQVDYPNPSNWKVHGTRSKSSMGSKWNPADPSSASDTVGPLLLARVWRAVGPQSDPEHDRVLFEDWQRKRRWSTLAKWDNDLYLPYDEVTWDALHDFRLRIQELDHGIRTLLSREDFKERIIAASRTPLLLGGDS